jgi:type I restriction enzyme, S subunit
MKTYAEMKVADSPWLGAMPAHWTLSRFRYEAVINGGQVDPRNEPWNGMTLIAPNHVESNTGRIIGIETAEEQGADSGKYLVEPGQLVYSKIRPALNKVTIAETQALCSADMYAMSFTGRVEPRYALYYFLARPFNTFVTVISMRVKMPKVNREELADAPWLVPPLEEQRAIADYLDRETARIDTLIAEQQRLIEMLRERRAAVLSAMFNTGPSTETTKVGRLLAARPSYGVLVPKYVDEVEGVPFVRVGDLLNLAPERPMLAIAPEQSDEYSRTKVAGGEVLLGVVGKMGQAALAPQWLAGANVARAVAVLRCKEPAVAPLLCAWFGSISFLWQAELATSGDSIQPTLGMKDLAEFDINLPINPNAAVNLAGRLAKIDALIAETGRFIELSKERRAALITAAVTGQIDVREMA